MCDCLTTPRDLLVLTWLWEWACGVCVCGKMVQTAKVPSIPWSGDGLEASLTEEGTIPDDVFKQATVNSLEEAISTGQRVGYPIMVKASEGGGGKGIRMCDNEKEVEVAYSQVCAEVPGSPVFMMQLCSEARHLEVQVNASLPFLPPPSFPLDSVR